jgi:hypothetical protein
MANRQDLSQGLRVQDSVEDIPIFRKGIHLISAIDRNNLPANAMSCACRLTQTAYNSRDSRRPSTLR